MDFGPIIAIALALLGLAAAVPLVRRGSSKATIELLRSEVAVEREARQAQEARCQEQMADERERRAREVGELRGQVQTLTSQFAETISLAVVADLKSNGH